MTSPMQSPMQSPLQPVMRSPLEFRRRGGGSFDIASTNPTVMFDMSDMTTLFQDDAGTTPVTAAGQPVGLMLDKSQGLVLGPELVTNGDFSDGDTGWGLSGGWSVSDGTANSNNPIGYNSISQAASFTVGKTYLVTLTVSNYVSGTVAAFLSTSGNSDGGSISVSSNGIFSSYLRHLSGQNQILVRANAGFIGSVDTISIKLLAGNHASQPTAGKRPILGRHPFGGRRNLLNATDTLVTQSVTVTAAAHTLKFTGAGTVTLSGAHAAGPLSAGTHTFTPSAGSLTLTVSGAVTIAQLELGDATPYQKVVSAYDVTEIGAADCWYLKGDGVDDFMSTGNIDLTATDKVSVFAGAVRNSADAFRELVNFAGDPNTVSGSFDVALPIGTGANEASRVFMRGVSASGGNAFPAPTLSSASVMSAGLNLAGATYPTLSTLRVNAIAQNGYAQGSESLGGAFTNAPLWLFSRGGTAPYGTANLYPLIIYPRITTAEETANVERWLALKTGVTLPTVTGRYAYITPTTASAPSSGQIIHGDNLLNKLNIHKTDLDGATPAWDTLTTGSRVVFNGVTYTLTTTVQDNGTYYTLSVSPSTQQADATYGIGGYV